MTPSQNSKISVLIADDHEIVRQGIEKVISKTPDIDIAGQAATGQEVIDLVKKLHPDVVLMDIEMPEKTGWDVMMELKALNPKLPVLILSIFPEEHYGMRFIRAGASGYLNKGSAPAQMVEAIRKVHSGKKYVSPELAEKMIQEMGQSMEEQPHQRLSDREFQIFCMIASGKKLKEIADELSVGITTVSTHRHRILEKMEMKSNADLIHYAIKNGLI
ncbi:response regulator [Nitrospina watsonii]|uniref:Response regulator with a HTH DNA-binding domain n=1 Tax=Nitrospina watsonii TaxID=1323948 RepID=A0ABM9HGU5_9BACT|nr:response regulator transcription factor [Nitrospina watsonii]CAI2719260.1 Response regulator with a HTH DNA-binding domain [Nitrospina watsonii]